MASQHRPISTVHNEPGEQALFSHQIPSPLSQNRLRLEGQSVAQRSEMLTGRRRGVWIAHFRHPKALESKQETICNACDSEFAGTGGQHSRPT